jgi:phospholipase C
MTKRILAIVTTAMLAHAALAGPGTPAPFDHLFLIVLENRGYDAVIGNADLPTLNDLARRYGLGHPSLPNYVALISGDTWGSHSDDTRQTFDHPTLAGQLEAAGLSWKGYMQGLPAPGFARSSAGHGSTYAKKHDPFLLVPAIVDQPERAQRVVPLDQLTADLADDAAPTFAFIAPDLCHDLHGASSCTGRGALDRAGDAFVKQWVDAIMASSAWHGNAAIVITFDEGSGADNHVATIVVARDGPRGAVLRDATDHYALLRTLEDAWGLPRLAKAADAATLAPLFR